jgi:hypothetical protein
LKIFPFFLFFQTKEKIRSSKDIGYVKRDKDIDNEEYLKKQQVKKILIFAKKKDEDRLRNEFQLT